MNMLFDKSLIFLLCSMIYLSINNNGYVIAVIIISIIISSLQSYIESINIRTALILLFLVLCILNGSFICFIPLTAYDVYKTSIDKLIKPVVTVILIVLITIICTYLTYNIQSSLIITAISLLSMLVKHRSHSLYVMSRKFYESIDSSKEESLKFAEKSKELSEKQDYEINLATLTERNRIARDIHDNVGHLLSRSILQTGALIAVETDEGKKENLRTLKDSLSNAMDSIRSSVHNLYDESIDLCTEINSLINSFNFCPVKFLYDADEISRQNIKYCFITATKEALANVMKHSDADAVSISIHEHPALYQLIIKDNGSLKSTNYSSSNMASDSGIGLKNIISRVEALNGYVHISSENGFKIFISIPKK